MGDGAKSWMIRAGNVGESYGDIELLRRLLIRIVTAEVDWADAEYPAAFVTWLGVEPNRDWLDIHDAPRLARERGLRIFGHFDGAPGASDAQVMRACFALYANEESPPNVVIIIRDTDRDPSRAVGFQQARDAGRWPFECILASCDPEIEAWLIVAWEPDDEDEIERYSAIVAQLTFDPVQHPNRLTSTGGRAERDVKTVLSALIASGRAADERWSTTPLARLELRGVPSGLTSTIRALRQVLPRLLGAGSPVTHEK